MNEKLLHFIWQFQYLSFLHLRGENNEVIEVVHPGLLNTHQGPDFLQAKIKIDQTLLAGSVELHVKASDWRLHGHTADKNYDNVILHVVWKNDEIIPLSFTTLCLQPYVSTLLLDKHRSLLTKKYFVPCEDYLPFLSSLAWLQWKERLGIERLLKKAGQITTLLAENNQHWEETFWQLLARNFGLKINADAFFAMAKALPVNTLAKHKHQIHQLEAMLLGILNLIPAKTNDDYVKILQQEYQMLRRKFSLNNLSITPLFLRMRPASFPTVRLAQLAMLVHTASHLFTKVKEADSLAEVFSLLSVQANDYWHYHYRPGDDAGDYHPKKLGNAMVENIIINTVIPVIFAYGHYYHRQEYKDKALEWLQQLSAEKNNIITAWHKFGVAAANALESQALLELKNTYCDQKHCLACHTGKAILAAK